MAVAGVIERAAYHRQSGGWFIDGWFGVNPDLARGLPLARLRCLADGHDATAHIALCQRPDLADKGTGFLLHLRSIPDAPGPTRLTLWFGSHEFQIAATASTTKPTAAALTGHCQRLLDTAFAGDRAALATLLHQPPFAGSTTVDDLPELIRMGVDELVPCGPDALLIGWLLAAPGVVTAIQLCSGGRQHPLTPERTVTLDRPEVLQSIGWSLGFEHDGCGLMARIPAASIADNAHLAVHTRSGRVGYVAIPPRRLSGMAAIKRILGQLDVQADTIRHAFDQVAGPAIANLQLARMAEHCATTTTAFGPPPPNPRCTLIIPLFGRIDYLEYQIALMSPDPTFATHDIIYVLDDPSRRRDTLALAHSVFARFAIPFRLVQLADNRGYAAANNAALALARGAFVCFLNSDVFPAAQPLATPNVPNHLADALDADPSLGAIGPVLLFDDGSVQHEGMALLAQPALGHLLFPRHPRKGRRPQPGRGVERTQAITGACLLMRRDLALELGGFDEGYVTGDFEDCDLCHRLLARGLATAVDHSVQLHHLERQSQADPAQAWRRNLTLYNAWRYNTRLAA